MKYILKCGKNVDIDNESIFLNEETGFPHLLVPIELGRTYLDEQYRQESRPVPEECQNCKLGNKFTYSQMFVRFTEKNPKNFIEISGELTICYAVLDPKYRRKKEQIIDKLIKARKKQLENSNEDNECDEVIEFLATFSEKHFKFVPYKAYKGDGYEPMPEIFGVVHFTSNGDLKMMQHYNIRDDIYSELAKRTGQVYDEKVSWMYWKTKEECQKFIDLVQSLTRITTFRLIPGSNQIF